MTADPQHARVLMVDDEPQILTAFRRTLGRAFQLTCAEGGPAGVAAVRAAPAPFAVIVTDMTMPGMNGVQFIAAARPLAREAVFMMLTGNADQQTAAAAINAGQVFRFLNKPCPGEQLELEVRAAVRHHELLTAERTLLRDTVAGSIRLMADAIELASPAAMAYTSSVKRTVAEVAARLGVPADWQLSVAGSLCLIGLITIPGLAPDREVDDADLALAALVGSRLLKHIPRLAGVANMIARQRDPGDLPADPTAPAELEAVGARVLRLAVDLARAERRHLTRRAAVGELTALRTHDRRLTDAVRPTDDAAGSAVPTVTVPLERLAPGMQVEADVRTTAGMLLLSRGQVLSDVAVACLLNFAGRGTVGPTVVVRDETVATPTAARLAA